MFEKSLLSGIETGMEKYAAVAQDAAKVRYEYRF